MVYDRGLTCHWLLNHPKGEGHWPRIVHVPQQQHNTFNNEIFFKYSESKKVTNRKSTGTKLIMSTESLRRKVPVLGEISSLKDFIHIKHWNLAKYMTLWQNRAINFFKHIHTTRKYLHFLLLEELHPRQFILTSSLSDHISVTLDIKLLNDCHPGFFPLKLCLIAYFN